MPGPDLTNSLVGVLTRICQDHIAFMADIESMFHQVYVPDEHCDFLRFLWWQEGDLGAEIQEYQMTVHLFGAASSPTCCIFALKETARDTKLTSGPLVAKTIRRNFYVDDCLRSVEDKQTAIELTQSLSEACAHRGFSLTKFTSNSRAVLESVPPENCSKEARDLDLGTDHLPVECALGVQWCMESDLLELCVALNDMPHRREEEYCGSSPQFMTRWALQHCSLSQRRRFLQDLCGREVGWMMLFLPNVK